MAKSHSITVSDIRLNLFYVKQAKSETGEWSVWCIFEGDVLDGDGEEVPQMKHLTKKKITIAEGLSNPLNHSQVIANKDVVFAAYKTWMDEVRLSLADIQPEA